MDIRTISTAGYDLFYNTLPQTESYVIWNGTGELDLGMNWYRSGYGSESYTAKYAGSYGLDITGIANGDYIRFKSQYGINVSNFNLITMYVKIIDWQTTAKLRGKIYYNGSQIGVTVDVDDFINENIKNSWQLIYITLSTFQLNSSIIDQIDFYPSGNIDMYLDNIYFGVGGTVYTSIPICAPDGLADNKGTVSIKAHEVRPSVRVR